MRSSLWDLNLVLLSFYRLPVKSIRDIAFFDLTHKVAFLLAITSVRQISELVTLVFVNIRL